MTIYLGEVELDRNLLLSGADRKIKLKQSIRYALQGGVVRNYAAMSNGFKMVLYADERGGYFTRGQIQDIVNLMNLGQPVGFDYNGQYQKTVVIVDPVSFEELVNFNVHQSSEIGYGLVTLLEV